jgi:predicted RNA binding protein YcfA (HicA-like mRNA interferase family)
MSKRDKLLQRLRNNPKNVTFDELVTLLGQYGILLERVRGSHHVFNTEIGDKTYTLTIPYHRPLKAVYIKNALDLIAIIEAAQESNDEDDDEQQTD